MARTFIEEIYFDIMERGSAAPGQMTNGQYQDENSSDVFDAIKRKVVSFSENFLMQGFLPFRRKASSNESTPEDVNCSRPGSLGGETIEMSRFGQQRELTMKGHEFYLQQLSNPTWCDECGDFIWGLYKQCLRCHHCQFTCHQKCGPLVRLGCKASPVDEGLPPDPLSAETSLTDPPDQQTTADTGSEATNEKDETDSGYRSGTIPDEKLPRKPSQATLNREELKRKIEEYNSVFPAANVALKGEKGEAFQGFIKVVLNLIRPICMSLGARPPSIYEMLTKEHIVEQNTLTVSFYMPRDTCKSIHITSDTTATDVISMLLKKFHILDHPRKFALYEQEHSPKGKIVKLRRLPGNENLLSTCVHWEKERLTCTRLVLQENETGEIVWENFSKPELENFLLVLDREEREYISQLQYKYCVMKKIIHQRFKELRKERRQSALLEKQASTQS